MTWPFRSRRSDELIARAEACQDFTHKLSKLLDHPDQINQQVLMAQQGLASCQEDSTEYLNVLGERMPDYLIRVVHTSADEWRAIITLLDTWRETRWHEDEDLSRHRESVRRLLTIIDRIAQLQAEILEQIRPSEFLERLDAIVREAPR